MARPAAATNTEISLWIAQRAEIDRRRLGVAEQEGRVREHQQRWRQDRVPNGSMCLRGLKLTRPGSRAVLSPKSHAT
jgi:hypothetical protein